MDSVLQKLNLGHLITAFNKERITPDIVCKMSLYDMRRVGLHDRHEIMKLRTTCISHVSGKPVTRKTTFGGAPRYQIPQDYLETLMNIGFKIKDIARMLKVSQSTVYRRMRMFGLEKLQFTEIDDVSLTVIVKQTLVEFPSCGERMLIEILRQKNINVQRYRLRDILHEHDKVGVASRRLGRLHRRVYHVSCPNEIWHVDTHHKLIRWGFVIIGAIDGFSRFVTVLHCLDNNRADSLHGFFLQVIERFGIPSRVRTDMGMENSKIAEYMYAKRGPSGIITGKSTHNQRIERLWRDVFDGVLIHFYKLFTFMEDENILDVLNPLHLHALHHVFKHRINEKLDIWRGAWASHRLRTVGSSPLKLWTSGMLNSEKETTEVVNDPYDGDGHLPLNQATIFQPDELELNDDQLHKLTVECPKNWTCSNFGINVYQRAVHIITE